jgi:hypothetical protein
VLFAAETGRFHSSVKKSRKAKMPKVNVSVTCQLTQHEALSRIQARLLQIKARFSGKVSDLTENWNGYVGTFSGSARGFSVSGNLVVSPSAVTVEIALPLIALPFKGQIEAGIRNELSKLLA